MTLAGEVSEELVLVGWRRMQWVEKSSEVRYWKQ